MERRDEYIGLSPNVRNGIKYAENIINKNYRALIADKNLYPGISKAPTTIIDYNDPSVTEVDRAAVDEFMGEVFRDFTEEDLKKIAKTFKLSLGDGDLIVTKYEHPINSMGSNWFFIKLVVDDSLPLLTLWPEKHLVDMRFEDNGS